MRLPWMYLFATILAFAVPGCGSPEGTLCNLRCDCEGCSQSAYDACFNAYDADARSASFRGCIDLYDELLQCQQATGTCVGTNWETSCKNENDRLHNCIK